ncbi:unnamed protein product [Oncorhynchus mykiss]|uniref:PIK helical domain-containing protein n=1 Tax=Oncorhynchus mykiss TaxID=8022 RepID=A0A060WRF4_ONCMY|nr:unnamed protein product [Oncorhynchus mykiss]
MTSDPLQVDFPSPAVDVLYVGPQERPSPDPNTLEELDPDLRRQVDKLCSRASTFGLTRADRQLLWDQRHHCRAYTHSLPKVLASAPSWDWGSMAEIHSLLHHWPSLQPVCALELLHSKFADTEVRSVAVSWIESSSDDELADYLPQLVQVDSVYIHTHTHTHTHTGNHFVSDSECFPHPISLSLFFWLFQALKFECHLRMPWSCSYCPEHRATSVSPTTCTGESPPTELVA